MTAVALGPKLSKTRVQAAKSRKRSGYVDRRQVRLID